MNPLEDLIASLNQRLADNTPLSADEEDFQYWADIEDKAAQAEDYEPL